MSLDDGAHWEPLQLNLPRVSVRDLAVHGHDLVAATHGRAFWILDDISSLRQMADSVTTARAHLFQPAPALRWVTGGGQSATEGENPRGGATIDYWLKDTPKDKVHLQFLDASGTVIRTYDSELPPVDSVSARADSATRATLAARGDSLAFDAADSVVSARAGSNRFSWNLRYPGATALKNTVLDEGTLDGPMAPPGTYRVRLIVGADSLVRTFAVVADPRVKTTAADLIAQFQAALRVRNKITELAESVGRIEDTQSQIDARVEQSKDQGFAKRVADAATPLRVRFEALRDELTEVSCHVDQCTLDQPIRLYNMLISLNAQIQSGDYGPTKQHGDVSVELATKVGAVLQRLQQLENAELAAFNKLLQDVGLPPIYQRPRKTIL